MVFVGAWLLVLFALFASEVRSEHATPELADAT